MKIHELPTPVLLLDIDIFQSNITTMADHVSRAGKKLRPHAKAHKCVEIARRQIAAGAAGVCAATVPEAELMVRAGVPGVLLTSPVADARKCARIAELASLASEIAVVVDHRQQVETYAEAVAAAGAKLNVLVDLDVGDHRTGIAPGDPALKLAIDIESHPSLQFSGLQAYSVRASHLTQNEGREEFSAAALKLMLDTRDLLLSHGIATGILTGGSTGTYGSDAYLPSLTELQAGSYALMDVAYARIGIAEFGHALSVLATVVSANYHDRVTVDAGFKAFSTDRPFGPDIRDAPGLRYAWAGDEFGYVIAKDSSRLKLGDRLRFIPPHCDPTVNLYDRIYVCRGDNVEEEWSVMGRVVRA